jgi:hypothetical protein
MNGPILITTDFTKQFKLAVDAGDVGVDAVLFQEVSDVDRPILFFSKKLILSLPLICLIITSYSRSINLHLVNL